MNYSGATLGKMTRPDLGYSQNIPTMEDIKREETEGVVAKSHCHKLLRQQGRPVLQCLHCGPNGTKMEVLIPSEPVPFLLKHVFILIYSTI